MATAKLKSKKPAAKKPAVKRTYRRRIKDVFVEAIAEDLGATLAPVSVISEEAQRLIYEREAHAKTRAKLEAAEGLANHLQHQLDAVRHVVSQTIYLRDGAMAHLLEFSPVRSMPDRVPASGSR